MKHFLYGLGLAISLSNTSYAGEMAGMAHHHDGMQQEHSKKASMSGMFLHKKEVDGYTVSFHVMQAPDGMQHGGSHHFMIKVEKDQNMVSLKAVNSKVVFPDQHAASKMMMKMGDWYMAGYDLPKTGNYSLMILFKTEDGKKHKIGIRYPKP